ncbi:MAG TPA: globin family protein [Candidatus Cybelea sp.]|nr:globin family protein [Candidatus Cybelea sp.]
MTPRQIELVKTSFAKIAPYKEQAAELLYCRLFELDPSLRLLFPSDMTEQKQKVMTMLAVMVSNLDKVDTLLPSVRELGRRHRGYGVLQRHYAVVGQALLWALEIGLGSTWTREHAEAWQAIYEIISAAMMEGANTPDSARKATARAAA